MRDRNKIRTSAVVGVSLIVLVVGLGVPFAQGYPTWMNETWRNLDPDVPLLSSEVTEADYKVTYTYVGEDEEQHVVEITGAALSTLGVSTGTTSFPAELRLFGVDLGAVTLATAPLYDDEKDLDHFVTIQFPETADILWEETVRSWCSGFVLDRGAAPLDPTTYVFAQDYRISLGSGDETLDTVFLDEESLHVSESTGDATTNRIGTCLDREDIADTNPEFGDTLSMEDVIDIQRGAYGGKGDPTRIWIKVHGPRGADASGDELGDAFDVALQLYGYDPESRSDYSDSGVILIMNGVGSLAASVLLGWPLRVDSQHLRSNTQPKEREDPYREPLPRRRGF